MSVRQNNASNATTVSTAVAPTHMVDMTEASQETALAEGNNFNVLSADAPLKRNVVVSIKSTLNDLCLQVSLFTLLNALVLTFVYITLVI
jgi:hypothetical protein